MAPRRPPSDNDEARRRRRTDDTRRWRSRCRRRVQLFTLEIDDQSLDMAIKFGGLNESQINNKDQVAAAIGRLLRAGMAALLENSAKKV